MKYLFTFLCVLSTLLISCKKETETSSSTTPNPEPSLYKLDSKCYPYLFDVGSYWIYQDTSTNELDSIWVTVSYKYTADEISKLPSTPAIIYRFEIQKISYTSSRGYLYDETIGYGVISRGLYMGGFVYFFNKDIGAKEQNAEVTAVYDTLIIENNTYTDVVKMKINKDNYIDKNYNLYYTDSIGVIQKDILVNGTISETWKLIRYHINLVSEH